MLKVIDFYADWCGPCKLLAPTFAKLAEDFNTPDSQVQIEKVNVDEARELAEKYGVRGIPTVIFEKDGAVVDKVVGNNPIATYLDLIQKHSDQAS
jgi:thioredoxin 1